MTDATSAFADPRHVPAHRHAGGETALRAVRLSKAFAGNPVLRDVDLEVRRGEIHALVGENGAGKSTLINLITGVHGPDGGELHIGGATLRKLSPHLADSLGIATVHQELSLCPHLTVAENIHLGRPPVRRGLLDWEAMAAQARAQLAAIGMELDPDLLANELTLAEQQIVEFAKATIRQPQVLILDEATSALDSAQTAMLFDYLRRLKDAGVAIVYVSHRMEEIFTICDRITVLRNGEYVATVDVDSTSTTALVQMMIGRDVDEAFPPKPPIEEVLQRDVVLRAENLQSGDRFRNISFELHRGEILGLGGLQGQGQHDVLEAMFGLHGLDGELRTGEAVTSVGGPRAAIRRGIAYVPEDRKTEGLIVQLSVKENLLLPSLPNLSRGGVLMGGENRLARQLTTAMDVRFRSLRQNVARLSGGNQQKIAIAKWLPLGPNLYLLAEPTRGIDVGTKQEIYRLMRQMTEGGASILLITSDTIELVGLSDRVLVMYEREPVVTLAGDDVTEENIVHASVAGYLPGDGQSQPESRERPAGRDDVSRTADQQRGARQTGPFAGLSRDWRDVLPIFAIALLFALAYLFSVRDTVSLSSINNLSSYLFPLILTAMAQSVIMLTGGIDLSIGAIVSLATVVAATRMYDSPGSMALAILLIIAGGLAIGIFTGGLVSLARIPAIIVTLATSFLWSGLALFILATPGGHLPARFADGFTGKIGGVIPATLVVLAGALAVWKLIKNTPLGLHIYAVGDNPAGAFMSGVNVHLARIAAYAIAGVFAMIGGLGLAAYSGTGDPLIGNTYTLASIAAAVLGGISFFGGQGRLRGTVAGALILGLLIQILFISGLSPSWQRVIQGAVLIVALGIKAVGSSRFKLGGS
jgi:ABC-type sugar transport system ATPase subunit/ribose/xylose/arabinose/galactoside ABC-type transport system permease subunit